MITTLLNLLDTTRADLLGARSGATTFRRYDAFLNDDHLRVGELIEIVGGGAMMRWIGTARRLELLATLDSVSQVYPDLRLSLVDAGDGTVLRKRLFPGRYVPQTLAASYQHTIRLVARGMSNKEIGVAQGLCESTIKNRLSNIYKQLEVLDRTQLAIKAHDLGLVHGHDQEHEQ